MKSFKPAQYFAIFLLCLGIILYFAPTVSAAETKLLPECVSSGNCTLCDIIQTVINAGKILLGVIGSIVLLMFVIGGFYFLVSGGEDAKIKKGREIIYNAIIGLIIVLSAYLIVTVIISVVTKQDFNLEAKLTCTPVDFAPKPPDNAANLTAAIPPAAAPGTKVPEGGNCKSSTDCTSADYFCMVTNENTGEAKCQKKFAYKGDCFGKPIDAWKALHDKGIAIGVAATALLSPVGAVAGVAVVANTALNLSDEACLASNGCDIQILAIPPGIYCSEPKYGEGATEEGAVCTKSNLCTAGTYCQIDSAGATSGKCAKKSIIGQPCISSWILDGNPNQICNYPLARCDRSYCVPKDGTGKDGQICTSSIQCQSGSCACAGAATARIVKSPQGCETGFCTKKILTTDTVTFCDGWSVDGDLDRSRCVSGNCYDTPLTGTGKCVAP